MRHVRRIALACVAAAAVAEAALRLGFDLGDPPLARLDPETEYELQPSASYRRWGATISINSHGMRGREPTLPRPDNERRILLIGDSVVYGSNSLDQDHTLASALERRLATATSCEALALPMAASSWGPVNQRAALGKIGVLDAEVAVAVLSAHDLYDVPLPEPDVLPYRLERPWGAIGDAIEIVVERSRQAGRHRSLLDPPEVRAERSIRALDEIVALLGDAGTAPVLAYHPTRTERATGAAAERDRFRAWAAARDVHFLDLGSAIEAAADGYLDDIHPDALGTDRMAGAILDVLRPALPRCAE